jgi:hypothetical protein
VAHREHDGRDEVQPQAEAVTRVAEQVRDARDQVFRAYVRSREKARALAAGDHAGAPPASDRRRDPFDGRS